jgi:phosphoribosylaminoimidazole-succinocarboxamide synthase
MPEALAGVPVVSGKVREIYALGDELLMVASDRISAFDVVLPTPIPDKGRVLTGLSLFWFAGTGSIVPNHLVTADAARFPEAVRGLPDLPGRAMLVRRLTMLPVECVVRGYLAGSGLKDYLATGSVCGHPLPPGLRSGDRLPEPIFTPAIKNTEGHDVNIDRAAAADLVGGAERLAELEDISMRLYAHASAHALERGIVIADTKFELGMDGDGRIVLGDEALTPDSSRFWPADDRRPGEPQPSFDKQYVRDWLETLDWDKTAPGPELPDGVVAGTRRRYAEAYERLTGEPFAAYLARHGAAA